MLPGCYVVGMFPNVGAAAGMSVGVRLSKNKAVVEDFLCAGRCAAKALHVSSRLILKSFDIGTSCSFHFMRKNLEAQGD